MARILIFGGGLQAISVARSLKEVGHYVVLAAKHEKIARRSNYIDSYIDVDEDRDSAQVETILKSIIHDRQIDMVFPMEDAQAESLSLCKNSIEKEGVKCAVMNWPTFQWVSDKTQFLSFCRQNGFPHPKTERLSVEVEQAANYVGFPALIKPSHSEGAKGITLVNSVEELHEKFPHIEATYGDCSLQEYIANKDYYYNVMLYRGLLLMR